MSFNKIKRSNPRNPSSDPVLINGNIQEIPVEVDKKELEKILTVSEYSEDRNGRPSSGFYDLRRGQPIDIIELNLKEFKNAIEETNTGGSGNSNSGNNGKALGKDKENNGQGEANGKNKDKNENNGNNGNPNNSGFWKNNYSPSTDYNNIVYVEFPTDKNVKPGKDKVYQSIQGTGLLIHDAEKVPSTTSSGFTLATNNVLYLKGSFNADGKYQTGSANEADSRISPEPSSSLAADSIYVLSNQFDYTKTKDSKARRRAEFTEINAAFLTGVYPSFKDGKNVKSGGTHNFPRFLEDWSRSTFRYRGSMVALFESKIAANPINMYYYSPPERDWGFYSELEKGNFPPATPSVRSFFTKDFEIISESDFKSREK